MNGVRRYEYAIGLGLGALFLVPLVLFGSRDTEETALGIFSSQVHYAHLLRGEWLYWFNDLGFGTPMPIGHRLDAHPAFAVSGVASLRVALAAMWAFQVAIAVIYMLRLMALGGVRHPVRLWLLVLYLFSVESLCWFYMTDWVTFVIGWTSLPALLFYLRQALDTEASGVRWPAFAKLALAFAFVVLNSHPGYVAPLATALTIFAFAARSQRVSTYGWLCLAAVACVAITSERLYYFATEAGFFPAAMTRYSQDSYKAEDYFRAFALPVAALPTAASLRFPFIGVVLGLAALSSPLLWRTSNRFDRAHAVVFVASLGLSLLPPEQFAVYTAASGSWLFRDPMFLFGILAAGPVLQRAMDAPHAWLRKLALGLLVLQSFQQWQAIRPAVVQYFGNRHSGQFAAPGPLDLVKTIDRHTPSYGKRIYLSLRAQRLARGQLTDLGIFVVTDLALRGLNPVNAWFKTVSMDRLYPSMWFMHGYIEGQRTVIENGPLLDALGIGLVLTEETAGVPAGLVVLERLEVDTPDGPTALLLLGNPDAWPHAVVLSTDAGQLRLPHRPDCYHLRALCHDFSPLVATRQTATAAVITEHGRYEVRVPASATSRLLFLSTTYRPEWEARSAAGTLPVDPVGDAFIGVTVPPGVETVELRFRPVWRIRLTWFSILAAVAIGAALGVRTWRHR